MDKIKLFFIKLFGKYTAGVDAGSKDGDYYVEGYWFMGKLYITNGFSRKG